MTSTLKIPPELDPRRLPRHVAIIMDGNGRWASLRGLPRVRGHQAGAESVREIVRASGEWGLEVLTLYAFSTENWTRPAAEVTALWALLKRYLRQEERELMDNRVRLTAMGRLSELPREVQQELERVRGVTAGNTGLILNLALNYSGRADLVDAFQRILDERASGGGPRVTEEMVAGRLGTAGLPDPDLLIRTSGEQRISNFLLWEAAYAEWWITETLWPDFRRPHLLQALMSYQQRERRFGGVEAAAPPPPPAKPS